MEMALFANRKSGSDRPSVSYYLCLVMLVLGAMAFSSTNHAQERIAPVTASPPPSPGVKTIGLPDVFAHVALVQAELELIRFEMGKPKDTRPEIAVKDAEPREAYFQALTLIRKANRLSFEHRREYGTIPDMPKQNISAANVYALVDTALERIHLVKRRLGINEPAETSLPNPNKTASDVYSAIVQANRQLNLLLDQQFTPSDVFEQVTLAVSLASHLLDRFPDAKSTPPPAPAFERGKQPADVYRRLIDCYWLIRQIARSSGLNMLTLETGEARLEQVTPSDVYDLAALVVAELSYLHAQLEDAQPHREIYYPGRKFPSHVYQRAGILEKQLIDLQRRVKEQPNWLRKS